MVAASRKLSILPMNATTCFTARECFIVNHVFSVKNRTKAKSNIDGMVRRLIISLLTIPSMLLPGDLCLNWSSL